jgi:hypothetical protein
MAVFLATAHVLRRLAQTLDREPNDQAVVQVFDALVLGGHLKPFIPNWWELCRLNDQTVLRVARRCGVTC